MQTNLEKLIKGYTPFTSKSLISDQTNPMETDRQYFLTEKINVVTQSQKQLIFLPLTYPNTANVGMKRD